MARNIKKIRRQRWWARRRARIEERRADRREARQKRRQTRVEGRQSEAAYDLRQSRAENRGKTLQAVGAAASGLSSLLDGDLSAPDFSDTSVSALGGVSDLIDAATPTEEASTTDSGGMEIFGFPAWVVGLAAILLLFVVSRMLKK